MDGEEASAPAGDRVVVGLLRSLAGGAAMTLGFLVVLYAVFIGGLALLQPECTVDLTRDHAAWSSCCGC